MFKVPGIGVLAKWLAVAMMLCLGWGAAIAQTEPTLDQIFKAAQSGKMDQAQTMIQQVLISHPNSAKAHFVQAELFVRQGKLSLAAPMLATAEKLAPGLPFAKPEAVQSLRDKLGAAPKTALNSSGGESLNSPARSLPNLSTPTTASAPWALPLLLAGGVIAAGYFIFRKKSPQVFSPASPAPVGSGLNGPQAFGANAPQAPAYAEPASSGIGSKIAGGLATGLAVGAGVMAAEAIGKNLFGHHDSPSTTSDGARRNNFEPIADSYDMGGQDFGVKNPSSWDDSEPGSAGGDWDS